MKCVRCGKALLRPPNAVVQSKGGMIAWGPKCAVIAGLVHQKKRGPKLFTKPRRKARIGQVDWVEELCSQ